MNKKLVACFTQNDPNRKFFSRLPGSRLPPNAKILALRVCSRRIVFPMKTLRIRTDRRTQLVDVTDEVQRAVRESGVKSGVCYVYVPHTTAGVAINEHADPDVAGDVEGVLDRLVPHRGPYRHGEGNSDSHAKAVLTGTGQSVFVENGRLLLGTWQGIFFCEFDGPRDRKLLVKVVSDHS